MSTTVNVGILSLQGAFDLHAQVLNEVSSDDLEIDVCQIKTPDHLARVDAIILPGGESTVMEKLLHSSGVFKPLKEKIEAGLPTLGTCAGLILLANAFDVLNVDVQRNAYGPQIESFETEVLLHPSKQKCKAFFIRAPKILEMRANVEVLATLNEEVVGVKQGNIMAVSFHPEVAKATQIHEIFVGLITERLKSSSK